MISKASGWGSVRQFCSLFFLLISFLLVSKVMAQESICARVKIEIKQELTLERQAFDAEMRINNTTDAGIIENVSVEVMVTDENGVPVTITDDPNNLSAKFFVRISNKQNISAVDGTGTVLPQTTSVINWLLMPAPGTAGTLGKKYLVGATLKYKFGGEEMVLDVAPAVITVKPLPLLTLDYFLTQDVWADDPFTSEIEASEPFTLGVRVKNNGFATAKNLKIDSAQPKIIENKQGLLINFMLTGSYLNDAPVQNTLLMNFGDIASGTSKMGRWNMETTLAGKFTEFSARFSHADELGGALTSILQGTNAHLLIHDVRVDLPGRDYVRDFLARDGDVIRVYESDGADTEVTDHSATASLSGGSSAAGTANYRLSFPPTAGFVYVRLADPLNGKKQPGKVVRSDAKQLPSENVWLSKTYDGQANKWQHWVNFFDVNTTGVYDTEFREPPVAANPPVLQFIPDRVMKEGQQISFLVEASSPGGRPVILSAAPLPVGATFVQQTSGTPASAIFDWTPAKGTAGNYLVTYTASDGILSTMRSATIKVEGEEGQSGPSAPIIQSPLSGTQVKTLRPSLSVKTSTTTEGPAPAVQFQVYADEAGTQLVASAEVVSTGGVANWQVSSNLNDNTHYWWRARARASDGTLYSLWSNARFFVNLFNDPPDSFNLTSPAPGAEVSSRTPTLAWTNSFDKDGDAITYVVKVYRDSTLTELIAQSNALSENPEGMTQWVVNTSLQNQTLYYWRVVARDSVGAETQTPARSFMVNTGNTELAVPVILAPLNGGKNKSKKVALIVQNSDDAVAYSFEMDTVKTFDSSNRRVSGQFKQTGGQTFWVGSESMVGGMVENRTYWWRVKAVSGSRESAWAVASFLMSEVNDPPPAPTINNPGDGSWVGTLTPTLTVNPVIDPEGDPIQYEFFITRTYNSVGAGVACYSETESCTIPYPVVNNISHSWMARAIDSDGAVSAWSTRANIHVSTLAYQPPLIGMTAPAMIVEPAVYDNGSSRNLILTWTGGSTNTEPVVALYYSREKTGFSGTLIVDGLRQATGSFKGTYSWWFKPGDIPSGIYYIYAIVYDGKGMGRAYAPGAFVIRSSNPTGKVVITAAEGLKTSEDGLATSFKVRLNQQPKADVVLPLNINPRLGKASPDSLTFTPENWFVDQVVTVTGLDDCAPYGNQAYQVAVGAAQSEDPDFIAAWNSVQITNLDNGDISTTNNGSLSVCGQYLVKESKSSDNSKYIYTLSAQLSFNTYSSPLYIYYNSVSFSNATLTAIAPRTAVLTKNTITFGAIAPGETVKTNDTFEISSVTPIERSVLEQPGLLKWNSMTADRLF